MISLPPVSPPPPASLNLVDLSTSPRISAMIELMDSVIRLADPRQVLEGLASGIGTGSVGRPYVQISVTGQSSGQYLITRLSARAEPNLTGTDQSPHPIEPIIACGGILGRLIHSPVPKLAHELDLHHDPILPPVFRQCRSAMAVPLFSRQQATEWVVLFDHDPQGFSLRELEELMIRTTLVGTLVNNLDITQRLFDAGLRVQEEISGIAAIQHGLLPEDAPEIPGLRLATSYESVGQAGGDMYDFVALGNRPVFQESQDDPRWAILIGDVAGHGPAAAMVMAMVQSILHAYPASPPGPAQVLTHVNRHLCAKRIGQVFVTAFLAFYDPTTRRLTYARAGHVPPLLLPANASAQPLFLHEVGDLPLGIMPEAEYLEGTLDLQPGQRLILYTDGITEAKNPENEFFDKQGLLAACERRADAADTLRHLQQALLRHTNRTDADDDQTIVVAEVL